MKYILIALIFASSSAFANIPAHNINHTTIMTKDAMIVLDKKSGKFWKVQTSCDLPINADSNVRFVLKTRAIKEGSQLTFMIDERRNKHTCSVQKISLLS